MKEARAVGMLLDVDMLYEMTVGEYSQWEKDGKATGDLAIDPDAVLLQHSRFEAMRHAPCEQLTPRKGSKPKR